LLGRGSQHFRIGGDCGWRIRGFGSAGDPVFIEPAGAFGIRVYEEGIASSLVVIVTHLSCVIKINYKILIRENGSWREVGGRVAREGTGSHQGKKVGLGRRSTVE
jgi:hypothetical protein